MQSSRSRGAGVGGREAIEELTPVRTMPMRVPTDVDNQATFKRLQSQLQGFWRDLKARPSSEHTVVVVPSLSVNQEELAKVPGASFYEERLLFTLIRLRSPKARVIYLTSHPIHPDTIDYYLQLLIGVPASHAKRRLMLLSVHDGSPRCLTEKILERPRVIERLRSWIGDRKRAYITCYNSTASERRLAVALGVPINAVDPELLWLGTKSGSRKVFREAGVQLPEGFEDLHSETDVVDALVELRQKVPGLERAVIKLDEGFSGEGNALFRYPPAFRTGAAARNAVRESLRTLHWAHEGEAYDTFFRKFSQMGGIVEEFVTGADFRSPSAQLRINPDGEVRFVSTHDQVLGSPTGQVYLGGRFPADARYRDLVQAEGQKVAAALSRHGVIGRFGIDFVVTRHEDAWRCLAVEINLRMGGTTPPYMALEFLVQGEFDVQRGVYVSSAGNEKYYYATDNLKSPAYRGLLPDDLMDLVTDYGIRFDPSTETGVLFYMIGALSQYGKLGVVSIANSPEEADRLYERTVAILDRETGADEGAEHLFPLFDHRTTAMQ